MKLSGVRVAVGYVVFALVLLLAHPSLESLSIAAPIALAGEAIRIWASGHIEKTLALATGGPYAHSRNPLYVGSVLLALAGGIATASPWAVAALMAYLAVFYPSIVREEAAFLRRKFGAEYTAWEREVPLFLPRPTPSGPKTSRFQWSRVTRNREWRTLAALPLAFALLWARGSYLP